MMQMRGIRRFWGLDKKKAQVEGEPTWSERDRCGNRVFGFLILASAVQLV
jgi:hypothetical protein